MAKKSACRSTRKDYGITPKVSGKKRKTVSHDLCLRSSDTLSFFLPFALLLASTALPLAVDILSLKPCLFLLFRFDG
jgi:hypothetical protein